jgi:hypothetical protein
MSDERTPLIKPVEPDQAPTYDDTNLDKFRKAIGINVEAHTDDLEAARKGATGLYKEIISTQRWRSRQYRIIEVLYYLALGAQIVIGATLTALGPQSGLHAKSITLLGVVNTSIAGILAMLKGQGLPDRLRKDVSNCPGPRTSRSRCLLRHGMFPRVPQLMRHFPLLYTFPARQSLTPKFQEFEMKKVQDYIEETETRLMFTEDGLTDDELDDLLQTTFAKYNAARDTAELNRPDRYAHQGEADVVRRVRGAKALKRSNMAPENGKGKDAIQYDIS